jgi:hypothetical protein
VAEEAGEWALSVIATAEDTEAVRILAALPPNAARDEIAPWLRRAAHDLGVRMPRREESDWILSMSQARQARDLARAIVDGRLGLVEGSWKIRDLAFAAADVGDEMHALFVPFVAVTSETDHLPLGAARASWDPDVLREKDREVRAYDEAHRAEMVPHCRALAARVGSGHGRADRVLHAYAEVRRTERDATLSPSSRRSGPVWRDRWSFTFGGPRTHGRQDGLPRDVTLVHRRPNRLGGSSLPLSGAKRQPSS